MTEKLSHTLRKVYGLVVFEYRLLREMGNVQTLQEVRVNCTFRSLIICVLHVILLQFKKQNDDNCLEWS